jgi:hypothetical protein
MKRIFLVLFTFLLSTISAQTTFTKDGLTYQTISESEVKIISCQANVDSISIPQSVLEKSTNTNYIVSQINIHAFKDHSNLEKIIIPNSVITIGNRAFQNCSALKSVTLPENASIKMNAFENAGIQYNINDIIYGGEDTINIENYRFNGIGFITFHLGDNSYQSNYATVITCDNNKIGNVTIPDSIQHNNISYPVNRIKDKAFDDCKKMTSITIPSTIKYIGQNAFWNCTKLNSITFLSPIPPTFGTDVFNGTPYTKKLNIPFGSDYSFLTGEYIFAKTNYLIQENETKTLETDFTITNKIGLINKGVLIIPYGKQLIDTTQENIEGIVEVQTDILSDSLWHFVGAPFSPYKLEAIKPGSRDVSVSTFDYTTGNWDTNWASIETPIASAEGFLLWSFTQEATTFTNKKENESENYNINNSDVIITKNLSTHQEGGNWFALSNPYTFKLDVGKFILENKDKIQGQDGIYKMDSNGEFQYLTQGEINVTEGFFVNYLSQGEAEAIFKKDQRLTSTKSQNEKQYIRIKIKDEDKESELFFALNQNANQGYDIYDANKLFSPNQTTEPYFLLDKTALVKQEVNLLPYIAEFNIRSNQTKEISIEIKNIPEDITIFLLDNKFEIKMKENEKYITRITEGENADRFQIVVKKSREIEEIKTKDIAIKHHNREINIESQITDVNVKVFDSLGQEVFSTKEKNFTLNQSAGIYLVKVFSKQAIKTEKITITQ